MQYYNQIKTDEERAMESNYPRESQQYSNQPQYKSNDAFPSYQQLIQPQPNQVYNDQTPAYMNFNEKNDGNQFNYLNQNNVISYQQNIPQGNYSNSCSHMHVEYQKKVLPCETCTCIFCVFMALALVVVGMVICILAATNGNGGNNGGGSDCVCLCIGGSGSQGQNQKNKSCDFPSEDVTKCQDCHQVISSKKNYNGLGLSICLGWFGIMFVGIAMLILFSN